MRELFTAGAAFFCLLLTAPVAPASAQGFDDARINVSAGAGIALQTHSDFDFNAPEWQIALRANVSRHFLLEGFFEQWRQQTSDVFTNITVPGPDGVIRRVGRLEDKTTYTMKTVGVNWLGRGFLGRASITGGGGIGFMHYDRLFEQIVSDCQSSTQDSCQDFENRFNSQSFTVQGAAGVDVPITSGIAAFGQYQFVAPIEDVGFSHSSITGGVRVKIW